MEESKGQVKKEYTNGEITVVWKPGLCIHSANCVKGLPQVFKPNEKPWINVQAAQSGAITTQVGKCPSGALSFYQNDGRKAGEAASVKMTKGQIAAREPAKTALEAGKNYAWCACGLSGNQPFCDGSHKTTDLKPHVFKAEKTETVYLCQCKQTGNSPFCDGTHNSLA